MDIDVNIERAPRREDPAKLGAVDGISPWFQIRNPDPAKRYVWANGAAASDIGGPDYYEAIGYEPVRFSSGGPKPGAYSSKLKNGEPIMIRGYLLMQIDVALHARIEEHGVDGVTGKKHARLIRDKIVSKKDARSLFGMQGISDRYVAEVENSTTNEESTR